MVPFSKSIKDDRFGKGKVVGDIVYGSSFVSFKDENKERKRIS